MVEKIGGGVQWQYLQCPGSYPPRPDGSCPPANVRPPRQDTTNVRSPRQDTANVRRHRQQKPNPCPPEQETIVKTRDKKTGQEIARRRLQTCSEEEVKWNPDTNRYEATRPATG